MDTGSILLHDPNAIGLKTIQGPIGLYPFQTKGWMSGLYLTVDSCHYRQSGESSGSMTLLSAELQIPGSGSGEGGAGPDYKGYLEDWDFYKTNGNIDLYKPSTSQFLPDHTDYTTYAWTDAYDENFPYYYFGWGTRTEMVTGVGYSKWTNTAFMGLNYPIGDNLRPGWENVPPESELLKLMSPHIPNGQWRLRIVFSPFDVDAGVAAKSYISINVRQGRKRFFRGSLDFVSETDFLVGEDDADLSGVQWGTGTNPGLLEILDGDAAGAKFDVINVFHTDYDDPPPGLPGATWIIQTSPLCPKPIDIGVKPGDRCMLTSRFFENVYMPYKKYIEFGEGHVPQTTYEAEFQPWYQ